MSAELKDAYEQYRSQGFTMQEALRNKKFSANEGSLSDRTNEEYRAKATGYVAIIPPNLIIVDNDKYEDGNEFQKLLDALALGYEPLPFALTPSGGEHYAFVNPHENLVVGNHGFKAVDIYSGYQSVIPIVGTTVLNKQNEYKTYQWADEILEGFVINKFSNSMLEVFKMRERANTSDIDYDDLSLAVKEQELPLAEVLELCKKIPIEDYRYDTGWLKFAMAMYDRFEGSQEGLDLFQETCSRYHENNPNTNESKWMAGHFKGDGRISYKTLRSLANEGTLPKITKAIKEAQTKESILEVLESLQKVRVNTSFKKDDDVREELLTLACTKVKELTGKPCKVELKKAVAYEKPKTEYEQSDSFDVYRMDNKYLLRYGTKILTDISSTMLREQLASLDIYFSKEDFPNFKNKIQTISSYKHIADYTLDSRMTFRTELQAGVTFPAFVARFNPLFDLEPFEFNEEIVTDFFENVWAGKLYDIVRLIGLTIKFKETKLNRLMVIAPSNSGKSEIFTHLDFQKIVMKRLLNGMRGDKGVGAGVVDGIRKSGLLLIDEANTALQSDIKDMDKELHIDQFGSGGTQILPLLFTALTSTHSNATRNNSDELYNRFLQVELMRSEMKYTISESPLFKADSIAYTDNIKGKLLELFKETIFSDATIDDLRSLQAKYRLPLNTDLDDLLFDISEAFILETKQNAKSFGDTVVSRGEYFIKRKIDALKFFENRLGEIEALDVAKYAELLAKHFISEERGSMRVNDKVEKYYKLNLVAYTEDTSRLVVSQFDDLDLNEL